MMAEAVRSSQNNVNQAGRRPEVWPIESQEHLIQVSKKNLFERIPRKWRDYVLVTLGLLITILIFAVTVFLALKRRDGINICTTPQCIRSANNFLQSMNMSAEPCDNFYKFACDNWRYEHVMEEPRFINNWFEERSKLIKRDILEFLEKENSDDEPTPVHQARVVFDGCLDFAAINENGLETFWELVDKIGLPRVPLFTSEPNQHWSRSLGKVRRYLAKEILIGFAVMTSLKNSTVNQLAVATADDTDMFLRRKWIDFSTNNGRWSDAATESIIEKSLQKGSSEVVRLWKNFSTEIIGFFAKHSNGSIPNLESAINSASLRILMMKQNISQIENSENVIGPYINEIPAVMELVELQELVDNSSTTGESKIAWDIYFESIFEDFEDISLDFSEDKIMVYKREYFELLSEYLSGISEKDLELLVWWEVVYALAPHIHEELKNLKDVYTSKVLLAADRESRPSECAKLVYTFMDPAVAYLAVPKIHDHLVKTILEMISNIQEAFIQSITKLSWMDDTTKKATVQKIRSIKKFIGVPDWIADKDELETLYNITVDETTHLKNLLTIIDAQVRDTLVVLRQENNSSESQFNPLDINAYYDPSGNAISVPHAMMQYPFYDLGIEALNYGAIGSVLGHEMTHGLDSYGRRFDLNGNLNAWWTNESTVEFEKRAECYVQSYNDYYIPSINGTVNGNITLSENLADDGGLRNAFLAYKMYFNNHGMKKLKLPGLETYSHQQLFFLAHANMWCSEYTDDSLSETLDYDEHSPQFVRVNRVMQNMPEFAEVWNCPVGTKMNPNKKCKLWLD